MKTAQQIWSATLKGQPLDGAIDEYNDEIVKAMEEYATHKTIHLFSIIEKILLLIHLYVKRF